MNAVKTRGPHGMSNWPEDVDRAHHWIAGTNQHPMSTGTKQSRPHGAIRERVGVCLCVCVCERGMGRGKEEQGQQLTRRERGGTELRNAR